MILEQKVVKTGGWNRHTATCADNSREVEELSGGGSGAGGQRRDRCIQRSAAP